MTNRRKLIPLQDRGAEGRALIRHETDHGLRKVRAWPDSEVHDPAGPSPVDALAQKRRPISRTDRALREAARTQFDPTTTQSVERRSSEAPSGFAGAVVSGLTGSILVLSTFGVSTRVATSVCCDTEPV